MANRGSHVTRAFRHRDFRLMWAGAFLSFTGSWVQNVAQGWLVFELTHSEQMLTLVNFFWALPVSIFGIFAGSFTDSFNKQKTLVACQIGFAACSLFLAAAMHFQFVQIWHIMLVAFVNGCIATIEMPTRQSMVSEVVPSEDLAAAIPLNAMTFNIARIIGPWIGAVLLARVGPQACYLYNGLSFSAMIAAVLAIKYSYAGRPKRDSSIVDLVLEGARYTFHDRRLKTLFIMEGLVSIFGLAYLPLLPSIAKTQLGLDKVGLGNCYASIGWGAMTALVLMTAFSQRPWKAKIVKSAMLMVGIGLICLGFVRWAPLAYGLMFLLGMSVLMQFNTTNTLFQTLSPDALRGRVLSMHIWALNGLGPIGLLGFGWLANQQWLANQVAGGMPSVAMSVIVQGAGVLLGAIWALLYRKGLEGVA